ncbi:MAG: DUF305 domain-containing protein [Acidimicrobiia bacterium]
MDDVTTTPDQRRQQGNWLMRHPYGTLGIVTVVSWAIMFALTYVGVNRRNDIFVNLNRFYMAVLMVAVMPVLMMIFMSHMFRNLRANVAIALVAVAVFVFSFVAIRQQVFVGDRQFLRSMIPHHSIAVKTCKYAHLGDQEIKDLCKEIIESQEREITQMKQIIERLDQ